MIYYVDFDGTICPNSGNEPQKDCLEVLKTLKRHNHTIYIYSCRANPSCVDNSDISVADMECYLKQYNVPYDGIIKGKPFFNFIIDDRAIGVPMTTDHSVDWSRIKTLIGII